MTVLWKPNFPSLVSYFVLPTDIRINLRVGSLLLLWPREAYERLRSLQLAVIVVRKWAARVSDQNEMNVGRGFHMKRWNSDSGSSNTELLLWAKNNKETFEKWSSFLCTYFTEDAKLITKGWTSSDLRDILTFQKWLNRSVSWWSATE